MTNRRGFLATIAALLTAKPTPALVQAAPEAPAVLLPAGYTDAMLDEFAVRYMTPALKAWGNHLDAEVAKFAFMRNPQTMRVRFNPARLPA